MDAKQKMLEDLQKDHVAAAIRSIVFESGEQVSSRFREQGISPALCNYYLSVLADPLRAFLYKTKLYPFFLQDVEYCIQNADVFLTNNEDDSGPKRRLKLNVIRYISLMMHPGLVPPTPVERCMQLAYTAKVNSGCISRQTGAVVTDSEYNIISLGWNDVPYVKPHVSIAALRLCRSRGIWVRSAIMSGKAIPRSISSCGNTVFRIRIFFIACRPASALRR